MSPSTMLALSMWIWFDCDLWILITNTEKSFLIVLYCPLSVKLTMERSFDYNIGIERNVCHSGQHINSGDCGLINSASIDCGSWASWRTVHFLVSCLLKFCKHYLILSLCLKKRDFNILDNVFIAFHQSNSKWDFFAWLIRLLLFMCFVTHFRNLWFGVHITFHI